MTLRNAFWDAPDVRVERHSSAEEERNPRDEFVIELKIERIELLPELCLES